MATIKTTGTGSALRVLTKTEGGVQRVSCSCCEEGCCMYPADHDWGDGSDLPDAITLLGVGSLTKSGSAYGDTTNGVILESGVWAKYVSGVRSTQACLITGDGNLTPGDNAVEDQFAATYNIDFYGTGLVVATVTRASLCCWEGVGSLGFRHKLQYKSSVGISPYWAVSYAAHLDFTCGGDDFFLALDVKFEANGSPVGTYFGTGFGDGAIVSL